MVKVLRNKGTYSIKENGLWGKEREVLDSMSENGQPKKFTKLDSLQKKVLRKMKVPKTYFLASN